MPCQDCVPRCSGDRGGTAWAIAAFPAVKNGEANAGWSITWVQRCESDGEGQRDPWHSGPQDRGARGLSKGICPRFACLEKRSKSPSRGRVEQRRPGDHGMCCVPFDEDARSQHRGAVMVIRQTIGTPSLWGSRAVRWRTRFRAPQARVVRDQSGISKEHERESVISHR
jgi:hypothetical protein